MPLYNSLRSYTAKDDQSIDVLMSFADSVCRGTSEGGYFVAQIAGPMEQVDFINRFVLDFTNPSLFLPISLAFDNLDVKFRGKYTRVKPALSMQTSCTFLPWYPPSFVFLFPDYLDSNDWQQVNITRDTPFSIYSNGWLELDGSINDVKGATYSCSQWFKESQGAIRACFDNKAIAVFGSGFNIKTNDSKPTMYLDWFQASYNKNGSRVHFNTEV